MTAPARLTGLRVLGFKSFAERTTVEFGPGISAIVGPNGSGKSNLADALRWTLGEAGRSLRTRRAEDVIFAGSSSRRATGMADVTLLLDNTDRLLPLDYGEVELGRRLYRSGENECLLNRQRIRLRDLIDVLDAGNLADNAFLFIGQGMVDQALALRPEERRPLFEEAAGVRRHERRRRQAETELAEAESNLERLRDVLAELRPQARRLAAQAEQLVARHSAGHDLAAALIEAASARWHELAAASATQQAQLVAVHAEADTALAELRDAEEEGQQLSRALAERAARESEQRARLDAQRARSVELRLALGRVRSEQEGLRRDRQRITAERQLIETRTTASEDALARPQPTVAHGLSAEIERLSAEIEGLSGAVAVAGELGGLERRHASLVAQIERLKIDSAAADKSVTEARVAREASISATNAARSSFESTEQAAQSARAGAEAASAIEWRLERRKADLATSVASLHGRLESVDRALDAATHASLGRAVRARGGSLAAEGLEVDQQLRHALAAALGDAARAWLVDADDVVALPREGGTLVVRGAGGQVGAAVVAERQVGAATSVGGGALVDAIRRDPQGDVTRLLARTLWVPQLEDALRIHGQLAAGWQIVTLAGELVTDQGVVALGASDRFLALREERVALQAQLVADEAAAATADRKTQAATVDRQRAIEVAATARQTLDNARRDLSVAEEVARTTQRRADALAREQAINQARLAGLEAELVDVCAHIEAVASQHSARPAAAEPAVGELARRRDELRSQLARQESAERDAIDARRRAEVGLAMDTERGRALDRESEQLAARSADLAGEDERIGVEHDAAAQVEATLAAELEQLVGDASHDRTALLAAETAAARARERLRGAEARSRFCEVAAMEAVLKLEAQREQLLVELAGIGPDALDSLTSTPGTVATAEESDSVGDQLAVALDSAVVRWQSAPVSANPPSVGRLAALRRRFHELGAGNPFAAGEYAEARERLETMEAQAGDLEKAIASTRQLISDLNTLIASQFRATFAALEGAFARRFEQLFDGGEAQLALTTPDDLAATGIEITARPPGKKRQPLQMLSGGERALTAVALLLAMLEVRPVPFCVLDEVDAALDEANIARFAQALRGLADQTQFIVITHNRGTIEVADALYGVTIGQDAVSHVISLRLPVASGNDPGIAEEAAEVLA